MTCCSRWSTTQTSPNCCYSVKQSYWSAGQLKSMLCRMVSDRDRLFSSICNVDNVPKHTLSCTGVGKKAARSLLGGSLVRLAGTTDLVQVHFGTIDTKGHRVLLLQVGLHYPFTSAQSLQHTPLHCCSFILQLLVCLISSKVFAETKASWR